MQENYEIDAVSRDDRGKGASRRLRREGLVPGIIYGGGKDPQMIATKHNELFHHLENEAFYSHILSVKVDGKAQQVVLKDLQRHPSKPFVTHLDLLRVVMDEEIRMTVPLHFDGEDGCPGAKLGGTVLHVMSDLEIDDVVHLSEVVLPKGVTLVGADQYDEDNDPIVVSVEVMRAAEEDEAVTEEGGGEAPKPEEGSETDAED